MIIMAVPAKRGAYYNYSGWTIVIGTIIITIRSVIYN
jgi:hypothetical protein